MRVVGRSPKAEEWRVSGRSIMADRDGGLSMPSLPRVTGRSAIPAAGCTTSLNEYKASMITVTAFPTCYYFLSCSLSQNPLDTYKMLVESGREGNAPLAVMTYIHNKHYSPLQETSINLVVGRATKTKYTVAYEHALL